MKREPMVFAVAGMVFGFVLGYMAAHWEGLAEFERALQQSPNHKKALFNKGIALMESGRPKDAVVVWENLLKRFQLQGLRAQIERVRAGAGRS
jgi:cytochrome c-type biogenesis protein CcmH/NrfG